MPNRVCNCADYDSYCKHCDPEKTMLMQPDWEGTCCVCGESPIVPLTGMCGPCTFGEADTAGGNW